MRIGEAREFLVRALPKHKRILFVGAPGVGKTFVKMEACQILGWDLIGICSALEDPSTIRGYPSRGADGFATHCLFDGIARAFKAENPTVLDFDDLGMASESTMRSIIRLFQFGEIDGRKLPDHVVLSASTNDVGHGAGVYGMLEPLKSRFHTIVNVETHLDDVIGYGLAQGWPSDLLAYLRNSPDALHDWKPSKTMHVDGACPRGWDYAAQWINDGFDDPEIIAGCVGKGRATAYLAFRALVAELPDIDQILIDPDGAPVPENPSARFLVSMAVASRMSGKTFGQCLKYLNRMPAMFRAFSVRDAFMAQTEMVRTKKTRPDFTPIHSSRDFTAWSCSAEGKTVIGVSDL